MKNYVSLSLLKLFVVVLIIITLPQCQNKSESVNFDDIKNEFNEKKVKIGYWIEYRNQDDELQNEPNDAVCFRVIKYKNGYPTGEVVEYLSKDSTRWASYKVSTDAPNSIYKFNEETYTDTVLFYDKYGTITEKKYYYNDSLGTVLHSKFNTETSEYETKKVITKPGQDFFNNLNKLRKLEKYFTDSDKEIWGQMWDSGLGNDENAINIVTIEYSDGRKQTFEEKKQIVEQLIESAEINKAKKLAAKISGGTLNSLKRCRTYNDFVNWINGWEKSYTRELNKVSKLSNPTNRRNQTINTSNKFIYYSDGYKRGPVRGWVMQCALDQDLPQSKVNELEKKIDDAYDRCGDLYKSLF